MRGAHRRASTPRSRCSATARPRARWRDTLRRVGRGAAPGSSPAGDPAAARRGPGSARTRRARGCPWRSPPPASPGRRGLDRGVPRPAAACSSSTTRELLGLLDGWLAGLPADAFTDVLPLLRRTFGAFAPPERRAIGEKAARATAADAARRGRGRRRRSRRGPGGARRPEAAALILGVISADDRRRAAAALAARARRAGVTRPRTGGDARIDAALGRPDDCGRGPPSHGGPRGRPGSARRPRASRAGSATSARTSRVSVVRVMQQDAIERLGLHQLLLEPEMLAAVEPDVHLVGDAAGADAA